MKHILSPNEYLILESINEKMHVTKRGYTEKHPAVKVSSYAPVRQEVLGFISKSGKVSEAELKEFFRMVSEKTGKKTSMQWVAKNEQYLQIREKTGNKTYQLNKLGEKVLKMHKGI